jgi:hypothetical protein
LSKPWQIIAKRGMVVTLNSGRKVSGVYSGYDMLRSKALKSYPDVSS